MFDPLAPGFFDDPYAHYALLRARRPVYLDDRGVAFCFSYEDVRALLVDARAHDHGSAPGCASYVPSRVAQPRPA